MQYKAVIFDFDRTLFRLEVDWVELKKTVFSRLDKQPVTNKSFLTEIKEAASGRLRRSLYQTVLKKEIQGIENGYPIKGAREYLSGLLKNGFSLGIISRNSRQAVLKGIIKGSFPGIPVIGREDVDNLKPHPEGMEKMAKILNLRNNQCLYIGDDKNVDGQFCRNAGVYFYLFNGSNFPEI